ncbi:helix-turn-helix protein [Hoeflea marina]|uniref:Helix-turn-helix protein n=1 Tax=Hoeflea marina TaxID=274592 RepID=A0A317PQP1_9HYPH|nr:helix-turn-helix protein [Hoeflea marina]
MDHNLQEAQPGKIPVEKVALTIPQATQFSGLSRSYLYKIFGTGELARLKAGKRVLVMRVDLENYLQSIRSH